MGLEAALLGRPVIMLGDSPVALFPSASRIGALPDLPALIRAKVAEHEPERRAIVAAYGEYLSPFMPASHNDWTLAKSADELVAYVRLFDALREHVVSTGRLDQRAANIERCAENRGA
jgi:hypothetical protein